MGCREGEPRGHQAKLPDSSADAPIKPPDLTCGSSQARQCEAIAQDLALPESLPEDRQRVLIERAAGCRSGLKRAPARHRDARQTTDPERPEQREHYVECSFATPGRKQGPPAQIGPSREAGSSPGSAGPPTWSARVETPRGSGIETVMNSATLC